MTELMRQGTVDVFLSNQLHADGDVAEPTALGRLHLQNPRDIGLPELAVANKDLALKLVDYWGDEPAKTYWGELYAACGKQVGATVSVSWPFDVAPPMSAFGVNVKL